VITVLDCSDDLALPELPKSEQCAAGAVTGDGLRIVIVIKMLIAQQ